MLRHNFLTYSGKIIISLFLEILYFPIWWYSVGFFRFFVKVFHFLKFKEKSLGFSLWLKNIFVPMYGQSDITGRIISFFVRLAQVIFRGIGVLIWSILCVLSLIFWLILPLLISSALFFQVFEYIQYE